MANFGPGLLFSALLALLGSYGILLLYKTFSLHFIVSPPTFAKDVVVNEKLSSVEEFSTLPYPGCESIVCNGQDLYTGSVNGKILKITKSGIKVFAELGNADCTTPYTCGRPLGMRLSADRTKLIVADSYLGLFSVSLKDGTHKKLFPLENDFKVTFFDDFDILPNGTILLSEASMQFPVTDVINILLSDSPTGRLLSIDPETGAWSELLTGLRFPNGVQLHRDGKSVLIADTATGYVYRLPLDGGSLELFSEELPGSLDNIRASPRGGYWVPVSNVGSKAIDFLRESSPMLKELFLKLLKLPFFERLRFTKSAMLVRLDEDGKIIEVIRDPANRVRNVAEVSECEGVLYTGSYFLPFIGRLPL